ncbi:right-handed parallel beta-helix repeat-containing protein [Nocardia transvalensis]|uniref:right-handed parallel beta-helix repeat-containing protein n=1 Tax=Nocardia transvalensis TaxID=37333 RepID=UPI0018940964|nr:right-handed parallel beta-helix repeat-containing protein [Nocardia transvalensis]MBF6333018.1 right-handed parallel beta-helix repeat-containing protein [Nocardia transvalensis]
MEFHVSPAGADSAPGTAQHPFASLERARIAAKGAVGPVVVHLRAGTYVLTEPFELTEDDSGREGHRIIYQAYGYGTADREQVCISGGRRITGWQERDGRWLADVGNLDTRQLSVDDRRAERAGISGLSGTVHRTETGYVTTDKAPLSWQSPASIEFVYRGIYPWTEARCGVAAVTRNGDRIAITMVQPAFGWAVDLYNYDFGYQALTGPGLPSRAENDPSFLTEPGTFVLDRSRPHHHVLHYLPRPGEHPHGTRVVAAVCETLLRATGTRDVTFRGLIFTDATWLRPNGNRGFLHYHGNGYYDGGAVYTEVLVGGRQWLTVPTETATIPACMTLDRTSGITFEGCRFTRLGATALGSEDSENFTVRGCDFDTLAASAITLTGGRGALIEDNLIQHIGLEYSGSPGISLHDTVDCTVAHNQVSDVPHCGIMAGPCRGTRILRNRTDRTMGVLADGGGIYLAGPQGDSFDNGAVVSGNVIENVRTPYNFGLYTDYGAAWVTVEGNVVTRADNSAILEVGPPLDHVVYRGNFWDTDPVGSDTVPEGVTYENNTTLTDERELLAATMSIRARAGISDRLSDGDRYVRRRGNVDR